MVSCVLIMVLVLVLILVVILVLVLALLQCPLCLVEEGGNLARISRPSYDQKHEMLTKHMEFLCVSTELHDNI